jgi:hypothetical protein
MVTAKKPVTAKKTVIAIGRSRPKKTVVKKSVAAKKTVVKKPVAAKKTVVKKPG